MRKRKIKRKNPKREKIDKLISELKKNRKLFRGTYGRVAKTNTKYWEILSDIISMDPNFDGKQRFELTVDQIKDIKSQSINDPIAIKGTQQFINGNEIDETSTLRERVLLMNYNH